MAYGPTNDSQIAALESLRIAFQPTIATPYRRAKLAPWLNLVIWHTRDHRFFSCQELPERRAGDNLNCCDGGKAEALMM